MENVLQTLAGQYTQQLALMMAAIAVAASVWREPLLRLIQTPESIMPVAIMFLTATIWGIPGQYTLTIGAAVFRSAKMVLIRCT